MTAPATVTVPLDALRHLVEVAYSARLVKIIRRYCAEVAGSTANLLTPYEARLVSDAHLLVGALLGRPAA